MGLGMGVVLVSIALALPSHVVGNARLMRWHCVGNAGTMRSHAIAYSLAANRNQKRGLMVAGATLPLLPNLQARAILPSDLNEPKSNKSMQSKGYAF